MELKYKNIISFVWATNIEESLYFYCDILGFTKAFESEGWVELSIPGLKTGYMALNRWIKNEPPPKNSFVTFGVENIQSFREHLESHKVEIRGDVTHFFDEGMMMLKFFDPDGNVLTAAEVEY